MDRYQRQILLPQIGRSGQERLRHASVMLAGVGALGCTVADQLCRAGVGRLILIDRDVVELSNLHRQNLYTQTDASLATPKAQAAAIACRAANPDCAVDVVVADITSDNALALVDRHRPDVLIDSTDNVATRFLLNDLSIARNLPLVYGGCVGTEGRVLGIVPGRTPCLRCVFPTPPAPIDLPTCDTAGILGPVAAVVGAMQAAEVMRLIIDGPDLYQPAMVAIDLWTRRFRTIALADARDAECIACGQKRLDYLTAIAPGAVSLCGRDTVQVRLDPGAVDGFLDAAETKLRRLTPAVSRNEYLVHCQPDAAISLDVFADGRVLVHGTADCAQARALVARYLG
ncbi:MAG: ThiF family adenylyltransferase [Burkholderiales bacterium]|nr:ThiF family adenylyltransferase [Phycisphaerae bacterium]